MDRVTRLRIFTVVAETLSFSRAAEVLGVARSSVTKAINDLEADVSARLLDRTTRTVSLTTEGTQFLDRAHEVLATVDDAHAMFGGKTAQPEGRIRASVPSRIGRRVIVPALPDFFARYPGVELELHVSYVPDQLVREGFDCLLRIGDKKDSELIARKLVDAKLVTVASPLYLEEHGTPRMLDDLRHHRTVGYARPFSGRLWTFPGAEAADESPPWLRSTITATNADMYIASAKAGLGLAQIPAFDIRDELADGSLVTVLPDLPAGTVPISILYAHRRNLTPRVRVFVDWLSTLVRSVTRDVEPNDRGRLAGSAGKRSRPQNTN